MNVEDVGEYGILMSVTPVLATMSLVGLSVTE
jgi:hypothetical protein